MEKANVDNLFKNNSYTLSNSTSNLISTEEIQDNIFKNSSNDIEILDLSSTLEKNKVLNINELNYQNIEDDGYTVQGYTISDNNSHITEDGKVLITAYKKGYNSRIYMYDSTTGELEARITLNTDAHVGGVTFDSKNQILYITGKNGKVSTYDYQLLNRLIKVTSKDTDGVVQINFSNPNDEKDPEKGKQDLTDPSSFIIENSIDVLETVNQGRLFNKQQGMDTIYYHNGAIYSSTYTENGDLVKTEIEYERNLITGKVISIKGESNKKVGLLAPAVQGMAFYEDGDKTYLVTASSAKYSNSRLTLYEMSESEYPIEIGSKVISQDGLEGIYINNGEVSGVFEYEDQKLQNITTIEELKESRGDGLNYAGLKLKAVTWDLTHGIENEKEDSNDN